MSSSRPFSYMQLANVEHIEELHKQFVSDPESVDSSWRYFFEGVTFGEYDKLRKALPRIAADTRVYHLIDSYRWHGHLQARINPIALHEPGTAHELTLESLGFKQSELNDTFPTCGLLEAKEAPLCEIIDTLKEIYCGTKGVEYMGRHAPELETEIQQAIEPTRFQPEFDIEQKRAILEHLNRSELFETFLHTRYVGQKRFSLEGGETLIPILAELIDRAGETGVEEFVIGMAHRGRLNVLCNILNKAHGELFSEFEDFLVEEGNEDAGDVKYHKGFSADTTTRFGKKIHVSLTANPSHLESVDPVVQGKVRAKQVRRGAEGYKQVAPILIHGDSSIAGQGVVYETLQLYNIPGYRNGGTVHIIVNNQVGFTTLPQEYRSTRYSTDIAHTFGFPVFHVNAEDPEGCIYATQLALEIRNRFHIDVLIELNCYRKYGHNESDEPAFTQPREYQLIKNKKTIREIYRDSLIEQGVVEREMALELEEKFKQALHGELEEAKIKKERPIPEAFGGAWKGYHRLTREELLSPVTTAVDGSLLSELAHAFCQIPEEFIVHSKLKKLIEGRQKMGEGQAPLDWAMAEHLAFASILWDGAPVRLSGQDSQRGTFTQRHATWIDQTSAKRYFPLSHLKEDQGRFTVYNSTLSEFAALGFEFGYSLAYPEALVLWEAQFGDFANGGQIIFDQYMVTSAKKWNRYSGLVVLLPHGYEGMGAEHSSGRLERFLQLAGESNIQVVYPTTPAQYFHLLRRQVNRKIRLPLVIFTPKGLLRHPQCVSSIEDLASGTFQEILDDPAEIGEVDRLILCSGRVYYDLIEEREKRKSDKIAFVRIEQLYPFHHEALEKVLKRYKGIKEYFWVQEEPRNMGAYSYIQPILSGLLPKSAPLHYVGRNRSASTAVGSHALHKREYSHLMEMVFGR